MIAVYPLLYQVSANRQRFEKLMVFRYNVLPYAYLFLLQTIR